jgi:hypothetical protein
MPPFARAGLFCLGFLLFASAAYGEDSGKTVKPQPLMCDSGLFDSRRQEDAAKNISGIDCRKGTTETWACVAVADEEIAITEFTLSRDGDGNIACEAGASFKPERFGCLPGSLDSDRDFEGVTLTEDGLIAVTSLGLSRGKAKRTKWALFHDVPDKCEAMGRGTLMDFVASAGSRELDWAVDRTIQCGGLNVEGLERIGDQLYFGLRSPSERAEGIAYVISAPYAVFFKEEAMPMGAATLHKIKFVGPDGQPVQGIGIRDMHAIDGKLILLTGDAGVNGGETAIARSKEPEKPGCGELMKGDQHPNSESGLAPMIWSWAPGEPAAQFVAALGGIYAKAKAEGITLLPTSDGKADVILAIDDPGEEIPTQLAVIRALKLP